MYTNSNKLKEIIFYTCIAVNNITKKFRYGGVDREREVIIC